MRNLLAFFRRFKIFLIFTAFQVIALTFYFTKHTYPKNVFLNSTNVVTGKILTAQNEVDHYLSLKEENEKLSSSIQTLRNNSSSFYLLADTNRILSTDTIQQQRYILQHVHVISGSTKMKNNFFTIDVGENQNVKEGMGLIGPKGIIGFVTDVGSQFALVKSVLCEDININAMIKKNGAHGFLKWNGRDPNLIQLNEITNDTDIEVGDTIVTRGSGSSFSRGMMIGIVDNVNSNDGAVYLNIDVRLSENMNQVYNAFLVKDLFKSELDSIQKKIDLYHAK